MCKTGELELNNTHALRFVQGSQRHCFTELVTSSNSFKLILMTFDSVESSYYLLHLLECLLFHAISAVFVFTNELVESSDGGYVVDG